MLEAGSIIFRFTHYLAVSALFGIALFPLYGYSSRAPDALLLPVGLFGKDNVSWFMPTQLIFGRSHRESCDVAISRVEYD